MKFRIINNKRDKNYGSEWQPSRVMNNKSAVFFGLTLFGQLFNFLNNKKKTNIFRI